jgi:hypothetical protein
MKSSVARSKVKRVAQKAAKAAVVAAGLAATGTVLGELTPKGKKPSEGSTEHEREG